MRGRWGGAGRFALGVLAASLAWGREAHAAGNRVALIRQMDADSVMVEFLTRIEGELSAAGFQVITIDHAKGVSPADEIAEAARELHPIAVFGVWSEPSRGVADVWVADMLSEKTTVRHVDVGGPASQAGPSVLALRAVELLQGSLLELVLEQSALARQNEAAPQAPAPCDHCDVSPAATATTTFAIEAGAATLFSLEHVGPEVSPIVRASYFVAPRFGVRVSAAGLGTRALLRAPDGEARVREDLALVEAVRVLSSRTLRPKVSLGCGAYHLGVRGTGVSPFQGLSQDLWAAVLDGGIGAEAQLFSGLALALELHALLTIPYPMVRIGDVDAGRTGRPSILSSITVMVNR